MFKKHVIKATTRDKRGRVLSIAHNNYAKSHPIQAHFVKLAGLPLRKYLHAEIAALLRCKTAEVYSIHVERYDSSGNPKLAKPCPVCELAIKAYNVKQVTYTEG